MNVSRKLLDIIRDKNLFRRLSALLIGRSGLGRVFKIKIKIRDFYIIFHPTGLSSAFWRNPNAYSEDYEFIHGFLKEGDTYLDIGANVGVTVIPAAKSIGERGRVIAFEPHPLICAYLKENLELNGLMNVEIHNCALGNQRGYIYLSNEFNDEMNKVVIASENNIKVPIALLDDIVKELDSIALLKLDVEGYEKFVLEGARKTLEKVKCIYFEFSERHCSTFGYKTEDVLTALKQSGFSLFKRKDGEKELVPIDSKYISLSTSYENLFGIKNIEDFENRTQWRVSSNRPLSK